VGWPGGGWGRGVAENDSGKRNQRFFHQQSEPGRAGPGWVDGLVVAVVPPHPHPQPRPQPQPQVSSLAYCGMKISYHLALNEIKATAAAAGQLLIMLDKLCDSANNSFV
ncbi:hypothetical protein AWZ03_012497, partial [Drosophila navojoa]